MRCFSKRGKTIHSCISVRLCVFLDCRMSNVLMMVFLRTGLILLPARVFLLLCSFLDTCFLFLSVWSKLPRTILQLVTLKLLPIGDSRDTKHSLYFPGTRNTCNKFRRHFAILHSLWNTADKSQPHHVTIGPFPRLTYQPQVYIVMHRNLRSKIPCLFLCWQLPRNTAIDSASRVTGGGTIRYFNNEGLLSLIVIVISKFLKRHSKAKHMAPACSRALRQIIGVVLRI